MTHALVPLVIFFCVVCAAPARDLRERFWQFTLALPVALVVLTLTTPFQLVGLIEMAIQQQAEQLGIERVPSLALIWMVAMEGGSRRVFPIAAAWCTPAQTLAQTCR